MKKIIFSIALLTFLSGSVFAQHPTNCKCAPGVSSTEMEQDNMRAIADLANIASYPGGEAKLMRFLREHLRYPTSALDKKISTIILISLVVETDGTLTHIQICSDLGDYGFGAEAARVVQLMPKWSNARVGGDPVRMWMNLPILFKAP
jgi:periplasmic protein TonB